MAAVPKLEEEDARRPNRKRENLVGQRTRIVYRMKACLIRFGIRTFKPTLRKAAERLETLITPQGVLLPPNTMAEMRRDMARLRFVMDQIKEIETTCQRRRDFAAAGRSKSAARTQARRPPISRALLLAVFHS